MEHNGKCKFPHGHNYIFEVSLDGPVNEQGMVLDFSILKDMVRHYFEQFDHAFVLYKMDPLIGLLRQSEIPTKVVTLNVHPTAENLAQLVREYIRSQIRCHVKVTCFEQRDCWARASGSFEAVPLPCIMETW
jgi:6-pyruvoyltetrahydropterin/6-carboxytetrahydropterin synthase